VKNCEEFLEKQEDLFARLAPVLHELRERTQDLRGGHNACDAQELPADCTTHCHHAQSGFYTLFYMTVTA
jgi:hypothetical protein